MVPMTPAAESGTGTTGRRAIAVHCVRHRHLFLEMTNLRELLDSRVDPAGRGTRRHIGGVAFDS